jgi:hypothetical protein
MTVPEPGPCCFTGAAGFRAINVQLATGNQWPGRAVVALVVTPGLDVKVASVILLSAPRATCW